MTKYKWLITLIGVLALSILVWFGGPYIAVSDHRILAGEVTRLLIIMTLLLLWGLNNLRLSLQAKKGHQELAAGLAQEAASDLGESEVSILNSRFKEAVEILKRSNGKQSRYSDNYLYELPWYILIGPPGSGKTTALVNSGLNFPLEDKFGRGSLKGVGGTRHCDWWFTDQAVLIDTAGRYTTQDSHSVADGKAWKGFIGLLKKYRKRRPINGVLIAMGIDELQRQTEAERVANVNAIRARLQELTDQLGVNFPVYLLLTKCDLLQGFSQYFDMMGKEERAQVWGMTFPEKLQPLQTYHQLFGEEFELLSKRLQDNLLAKFHMERDFQRRASILGFPGEFDKIRQPAAEFIGRTFSESRFHDQFLLRGVYLTSGTQEGAGMQKMLHSVAGRLGFQQDALLGGAPTQGKSFFIRNLFQQIIFPEAELVSVNRRYESKMRWLQNTGYVLTLGGAVGMAALWSTSYGLNESRLNRADEHLADYMEGRGKLGDQTLPEQILPSVQPLLALRDVYAPQQDDWKMGFGLYQGNPVRKAADNEYQRWLQQDFFHTLQNQLAQQLRQNNDVPEYLHQSLKAYLMLALPERLDKDYVGAWLKADWQNRYADQPDQLQALNLHFDRLTKQKWPTLTVDDALVEDTRRILRQVPLARQIYTAIKERARQAHPMDYRFDTVIGNSIHPVFSGEFVAIPWLYTADGYHDFFKPQQENIIEQLADDSWVVGPRNQDMSDLDLATVQATVEKNYLDDYIGYWQSALTRLQLQRPATLDETVRLLNEMVNGSSPLRRVLEEVSAHTQLSKPVVDTAALAQDAKALGSVASTVTSKASKLTRIASLASRNRLINLPENPATLVDERFKPVHGLMGVKGSGPAPVERLFAGLTELQMFLEGVASSGSPDQAAYDLALGRMANGRADAIGKLKVEARHLPDPLRQWVDMLVDRAWGHVLGAARSHVVTEYEVMVWPFYERSIKGRYPLEKTARVDVTVADFAEFFRPGGIEEQFFKQYLEPFVDTRQSPWRAKTVDGQGLGMNAFTLARFEQAALIRKVFFGKSDTPRVDFKLKATYLDANINRFELGVLGTQMEYRHGPARATEVSWPASSGSEGLQYMFEDHYGVRFSDQVQGAWALFRYLDRQPLQKSGYADRFTLVVKDKERKATYELLASSAINPFGRDYLGQYELPRRL